MRKVFLSFLGTNNYIPCNYISRGHERVENVRFVQEATITWYCKNWKPEDTIFIFTTEESRKKNWLDNGHEDREGGRIPCQGLRTRLDQMHLQAKIHRIEIPAGKNEEEIWEIFSTIAQNIGERDELYLDITHAFRSLPLLATVVMNYLKIIKRIKVRAIGYGAMEAIGPSWQVTKLDLAQRDVPVFDLLPFDQLLDWSSAIDRFITAGDAAALHSLTSANVSLRKKEVKGPDKEADSLKKMADALMDFSQTLTTCRGKNIVPHAKQLQSAIQAVKEQQLIRPLTPLLEMLAQTVAGFTQDEVRDGVNAARWCLEHNLVQQGFTLLQETLSTFILRESTHENAAIQEKRDLIGMAVAIERENKEFSTWSEAAQKHQEIIGRIRAWLRDNKNLFQCMVNLSQDRNDLNHAGMKNNPMSARKFVERLRGYVELLESEL